jgi:hypothetical protein
MSVSEMAEHQELDAAPASRFDPDQSRRPDPGVVDNDEITRLEKLGKVDESVIAEISGVEKLGVVSGLDRLLGDGRFRQGIDEVRNPHLGRG